MIHWIIYQTYNHPILTLIVLLVALIVLIALFIGIAKAVLIVLSWVIHQLVQWFKS